jgi:hypothetical protein
VLKEVGKGTFKEFDEKGKVHKSVLHPSPRSQKTSPIHAINTRPHLNAIPNKIRFEFSKGCLMYSYVLAV